jgi:hypothetical protein
MNASKQAARIAGVLYFVNAVTGFFGIAYVPGKLIVSGNTAATASNVLASERFFPSRHRFRTDLRGRIHLPGLGSLPPTLRRAQKRTQRRW